MSPRTSWDAPASEGRQADVERYRRERATALKKKAEQADYIHDESFEAERDLNLSRMDREVESSEADFSTEAAAEALARHKRQKKRHGSKLARGD